jgi:hypothetical protein
MSSSPTWRRPIQKSRPLQVRWMSCSISCQDYNKAPVHSNMPGLHILSNPSLFGQRVAFRSQVCYSVCAPQLFQAESNLLDRTGTQAAILS